ncbi:acetamidase/formamidase [Weissella oryzae SG25]|uniref:Acetamidase/formamidase n=1 Tax=Weissella oryzae (strain DSM 25784 / JCM 18191 / LMG 30913 / SG25) TaxID=1329250 RepID=A0A069CY99_WEIOS|nr:acetamidase/formamidase family protein [Weissella oryzae]GAK30076.1 acetamidase/formamidase [Weissella oryzae SG25]
MGHVVESTDVIYEFSASNQPVLTVQSGATVVFNTQDCFGNQIKDENFEFTGLDWEHINPATGPVYIEDALPGDILKVEIQAVNVDQQAIMLTGENLGVNGGHLFGNIIKALPVDETTVHFSDQVRLQKRTMIGVIGVAPAGEPVNTGTPGVHGGNMDVKKIGAATTLYFTVNVLGALLAMGDLHALMADGEVGVSGAEIAGQVTTRLSVIKNLTLPTPLLVTADALMPIAVGEDLDAAATEATLRASQFLVDYSDLSLAHATMLLSLVGELANCQMVDPLKTVRMEIPKDVLQQLNVPTEF